MVSTFFIMRHAQTQPTPYRNTNATIAAPPPLLIPCLLNAMLQGRLSFSFLWAALQSERVHTGIAVSAGGTACRPSKNGPLPRLPTPASQVYPLPAFLSSGRGSRRGSSQQAGCRLMRPDSSQQEGQTALSQGPNTTPPPNLTGEVSQAWDLPWLSWLLDTANGYETSSPVVAPHTQQR